MGLKNFVSSGTGVFTVNDSKGDMHIVREGKSWKLVPADLSRFTTEVDGGVALKMICQCNSIEVYVIRIAGKVYNCISLSNDRIRLVRWSGQIHITKGNEVIPATIVNITEDGFVVLPNSNEGAFEQVTFDDVILVPTKCSIPNPARRYFFDKKDLGERQKEVAMMSDEFGLDLIMNGRGDAYFFDNVYWKYDRV